MSERTYYVICEDNCRFESMTKEQIIAAIAEATGTTPTGIDEAFITKIKEQNHNNALKFWVGTQAEYNALTEYDPDTFYFTSDSSTLQLMQEKIDEIDEEMTTVQTDIESLKSKRTIHIFQGYDSGSTPINIGMTFSKLCNKINNPVDETEPIYMRVTMRDYVDGTYRTRLLKMIRAIRAPASNDDLNGYAIFEGRFSGVDYQITLECNSNQSTTMTFSDKKILPSSKLVYDMDIFLNNFITIPITVTQLYEFFTEGGDVELKEINTAATPHCQHFKLMTANYSGEEDVRTFYFIFVGHVYENGQYKNKTVKVYGFVTNPNVIIISEIV